MIDKEVIIFEMQMFGGSFLTAAVLSFVPDFFFSKIYAGAFIGAGLLGLIVMVLGYLVIRRGGSFPLVLANMLFGLGLGGAFVLVILHGDRAPVVLSVFLLVFPIAMFALYLWYSYSDNNSG
jgi:hypothetical protein